MACYHSSIKCHSVAHFEHLEYDYANEKPVNNIVRPPRRDRTRTMNIDWSAIGSVGTAVAVLVAAWHVRKSTQQARTDFEDDLSREYRELARCIPVKAHLGQELGEEEF